MSDFADGAFSYTPGPPPPDRHPDWAELYARTVLDPDGETHRHLALRLPSHESSANSGVAIYRVDPGDPDFLGGTALALADRKAVSELFRELLAQYEGHAGRLLGAARAQFDCPRPLSTLFSAFIYLDGSGREPSSLIYLTDDGALALLYGYRTNGATCERQRPVALEASREPWTSRLAHLGADFDQPLSAFVLETQAALENLQDALT